MEAGTYLKLCPRCRMATELEVTRCAACGHIYRTRFVVLPAPPPSAPRSGRIRAISETGQAALRPVLLLLAYAGPLIIVLGMGVLKNIPGLSGEILMILLGIVVLTWLWFLSD